MDELLKILYWNCQGMGNKNSELLHLIRQHKIHIILLSESYLKPTASFQLPNNHIYRNNRPTPPDQTRSAGGTAILVANKLVQYEFPIQTNSLENTTIHIQLNNRETRLSAIYKRPINPLMPSDVDNLLDTALPTILAGDMNANTLF
uniref:Putative RNA-directed DNA polymerase n=1 Tax=Schizaphis graminum TaxID=13262 RepID=A0A2S2NKI5_SCHGA